MMEEDWEYWREQFLNDSSSVSITVEMNRVSGRDDCTLNGRGDCTLGGRGDCTLNGRGDCTLNKVYLHHIELPIMSRYTLPQRIFSKCKIQTHVRFPDTFKVAVIGERKLFVARHLEHHLLPPPQSLTDFNFKCFQVENNDTPRFLVGESNYYFTEKTNRKRTHRPLERVLFHPREDEISPLFLRVPTGKPTFPEIVKNRPLSFSRLCIIIPPSLFKRSLHCLKGKRVPTPFLCLPKYHGVPRGYRKHPNDQVKSYIHEELVFSQAEINVDGMNDDGFLKDDLHADSPLPPIPPPFQAIINRRTLECKSLLSILDSSKDIHIIEREFCESLPIIVVSPSKCYILLLSASPIQSSDLFWLQMAFTDIHVILLTMDVDSINSILTIRLSLESLKVHICETMSDLLTILAAGSGDLSASFSLESELTSVSFQLL